ncbi:ABC transporter permease subunit [Catenovulum sediminis]|uniref:ABC transporter permease subunit n=1 Tax=Catenovulum sediminis TaxID=1740262 RepID=A0ABV1RJ64_9ALTE|nr:ABC transporter permease subunit [Catenovulum sediminis]
MTTVIFKREFCSFFATPVAYVFIFMFLMLSGVFTFYLGNFYERGQSDLQPFFNFLPWLYLFLVPAIAMKSWAEERKSGTIELLITLPISCWQAVLGKFFATWAILGLSLILTFPLWVTVNYLGQPDNGSILAAYIGSWLMAGAFLAIGNCMSALSKNQVVAFILTVVVCFAFVLSGTTMVLSSLKGYVPAIVLDTVASFSFLSHFEAISKGVLSLKDIMYFVLVIFIWLFACHILVEQKKAD